MSPGTLYLIPAPLGETSLETVLPMEVGNITRRLKYFVAEQAKTARQYLKQLAIETPIQQLHLAELNEHTPAANLTGLLQPLLQGHDLGLLSEAGCPAIADPGADLVRLAHKHGIRVMPLVGPSSILLALMASGANGQRFSFQGYLPTDAGERAKKIQELEKRSTQFDEAIAFIEAPYRNNQMLAALLQTCRKSTLICTAADLTCATEQIISLTVAEWPKSLPNLHKRPTLFVLYGR